MYRWKKLDGLGKDSMEVLPVNDADKASSSVSRDSNTDTVIQSVVVHNNPLKESELTIRKKRDKNIQWSFEMVRHEYHLIHLLLHLLVHCDNVF